MTAVLPAATAVLIRDTADGLQTLLLRRNSKLDFAAGSWVFPGGRVEDADRLAGDERLDEVVAAQRAAARETQEEAGIGMEPQHLLHFAHWTTPRQAPKRYATWFFICDRFNESPVKVDGSEIVDHLWVRPRQALQQHVQRQIELLPPTYVTLWELSDCDDTAAAMAMYRQREVMCIEPKVCVVDDAICFLYPGDAGYESGDAGQDGERHRFWMNKHSYRYEKEMG